jgi:16S rRNA (adenine1518-N6/adenine1519-N6)-dimethyltransferase
MSGGVPGVPRSRQEVRALLAQLGLRPHKRFGQNFLADRGVLERIADRAGVDSSSVVLEAGPGLGTLTATLLDRGALVVAAEIDRGLAGHLRGVFHDCPELVLVEGDVMGGKGRISEGVASALREAVRLRAAPGFRVASNLPYGISTSFLTSLAFAPGPPLRATLMLQLEVARVLGAREGTDDYSALSVFAQTYFRVRPEFEVGRHAFFPEPDVDSAVVSLDPGEAPAPDPAEFSRFVQRLFQGRRKAIATSLRTELGEPAAQGRARLSRAGFDPGSRVDGLAPARIVELFLAIREAPRLS